MQVLLILCVVFISFPDLTYQTSWMTNGLVPWTFTCPVNTSFKKIMKVSFSYTNSTLQDQQWNFTCSSMPTATPANLRNCEWSGNANSYTSYLNYQCPNDDVMTGIRTTYDSHTQDRMFEFQCCAPDVYVTYGCFYTGYLNTFNSPVYYRIPDGYILRGVDSSFSATNPDRRWNFLLSMYLNRNSWLLLVISFFVVVTGGVTWLTTSYSDWTLECPHGKVIKTLVSTFVGNKDRQWNFTCSDTAPRVNLTDCEWSGYINEFKTHLQFQCPNDGVISGVSTYFDSNQSDRRFKFLCCSPGDYVSHACVYTPVMNFNTMLMNVRVPDNWYLRGFNADYQYKLSAYDRLYYFNLCLLDKILPPPECVDTPGRNITEFNATNNVI